jgi:alpha-beta hydrolase superfamily lysophospholipase
LSRDEAQVDAYIADPLCGFRIKPESRKTMYAAYARTTQPEALRRIPPALPLYLFVGDDDAIHRKLAYFTPLIERYRAAGLTDVSVQVYDGARHEVLNETNRDEVVADLVAWVERVLA